MKGETLCITFSKYEKVRMPEEFGQPPDSNTKDSGFLLFKLTT